jgi:hypothetical protein
VLGDPLGADGEQEVHPFAGLAASSFGWSGRTGVHPNEKEAAMAEAVGYVPVALTAGYLVELLPARWHAVNAYGIKVNRRTYDGEEFNPFRQQPSGVKAHKDLREVHCDISRVWVRDHRSGGWVTVFWTQFHRVAAPFGQMAWGHARARARQPTATEAELATRPETPLPLPVPPRPCQAETADSYLRRLANDA